MGFAIAGAIAAAGALSYEGSSQAASGAQGAAQDQLNQAQNNRGSAMSYASASPQELNLLGQQYTAANQNLQQQQQLMNSIDPALMEASKQALAIMQGGNAASTQPMFALRNQQRSQLVASLQNQYGPGAESTSIGQHALQNFDMQTQNMQTGQLGNLMGMASSGAQVGAGVNQAISQLGNINQQYGNIQTRQLNASLGTGTQLYNSAGANNVASTLQGQGMASLGNNLMSTTGTLAGAMYGNKGNTTNYYGTPGGEGTQEAQPGSFWGGDGTSGSYQPMAAQGNASYNYHL